MTTFLMLTRRVLRCHYYCFRSFVVFFPITGDGDIIIHGISGIPEILCYFIYSVDAAVVVVAVLGWGWGGGGGERG